MIKPKTIRYIPESEQQERRAPLLLMILSGLMSCAVGVGLACLYFSQHVVIPSPHRDEPPIAIATPSPARFVTLPAATPAAAIPTAVAKPSITPIALPPSGEVRTYAVLDRVAPLEIFTSPGSNYLVGLYDSDGHRVLSVFVQGGRTEKIKAPLGSYVLKYASGDTWYGYYHLFGPSTQYTKANETFSFTADSRGYSGCTVTLYKVPNGNLLTSRISADEF
jgi:hypothetical protein